MIMNTGKLDYESKQLHSFDLVNDIYTTEYKRYMLEEDTNYISQLESSFTDRIDLLDSQYDSSI